METAGARSRHEGQNLHSLPVTFKWLEDISSTLSSLWRERDALREKVMTLLSLGQKLYGSNDPEVAGRFDNLSVSG